MYGAVLGSFASAIIHRERENISWSTKDGRAVRSQCPKCKTTLKIKNLVPLVSWVFQRGKCSFCAEKISVSYVLLELFSALFILIAFLIVQNAVYAVFLGLLYPFFLSFIVLALRFRVFARRLLFIAFILIALFIGFHFYFSS